MNVVETRDILCKYLPLIPFTRAQYLNCVSYAYALALQENGIEKAQAYALADKCAGIRCQKPCNGWIDNKVGFHFASLESLVNAHYVKIVDQSIISGKVVNRYELESFIQCANNR